MFKMLALHYYTRFSLTMHGLYVLKSAMNVVDQGAAILNVPKRKDHDSSLLNDVATILVPAFLSAIQYRQSQVKWSGTSSHKTLSQASVLGQLSLQTQLYVCFVVEWGR
jgi:hypothetical protein